MEIVGLIVNAIIFILPAYCANAVPVIAGGGLPMDLGKKFVDGKPIFGKNKTFRGFLMGLIVGVCVGLSESAVLNYSVLFGLSLSSGALVGDLSGAFLKRRLGISPGGSLPIVDQVSFIAGAFVFSLPLSSPKLSWELAVAVLLMTPPLHLLTNFAAHKFGLKRNPW
jgi:CDP-2,3-bis-(O-geranylgeranyl)-sn-glycerol synthase